MHSRRPFDCQFADKPGTVYRILGLQEKFNRHLGAVCDHKVYFWLQRFCKKKDEKQPKYRRIRIMRILIPVLKGVEDKVLISETEVQLETLGKYLRKGYKSLGYVTFNYTKDSYVKLYKKIGLI